MTGRYNFQRHENKWCLTRCQIFSWIFVIFGLYIGVWAFLVLTDYNYHQYFPMSGIQECIP